MAKQHINIPIFIPHLGCPNQCVFCNQRTISGVDEFRAESVIPIIEEALKTKKNDQTAEIAFFGGSFTGIDKNLMEKLLYIANSYLIQGRISSIRCSTRPDYISEEVLSVLERYGVETIELGLQSSSNRILMLTKRGHTYEDERKACELIKSHGFKLGAQMMIGLPGASLVDEIDTAKFAVEVGADEARIYPTVVFYGTELCDMTKSGVYNPITVDEAVIRSTSVYEILVNAGIKVLRVGLCDSENLHNDKTYFAGPNHAAIGELVEGEYYYRLIWRKLSELPLGKSTDITIFAPMGQTSKIIGQSKKNKIRLLEEYPTCSFKVIESDAVEMHSVLLKAEERKHKCI